MMINRKDGILTSSGKTAGLLRMTDFFFPLPTVGEDYSFVSLALPWERVRVRGYFHLQNDRKRVSLRDLAF